jgi:hypothetical protein
MKRESSAHPNRPKSRAMVNRLICSCNIIASRIRINSSGSTMNPSLMNMRTRSIMPPL